MMAKRLQGMGQKRYAYGFAPTLHPEALNEPKKVKKPTMFFVCSMADLFHRNIPYEFIDKVMLTIEATPYHTYQILTKRASRMFDYFYHHRNKNVPNNVWLGVTVEAQEYRHRISSLTSIPNVNVRFLSCEPLLGYLFTLDLSGIDWVIAGGESGNQARPMQKEWVINIKRHCEEQGVPFFFKSWGRYGADGKPCPKDQRDLLDGVKYQAYPKGWEKGE